MKKTKHSFLLTFLVIFSIISFVMFCYYLIKYIGANAMNVNEFFQNLIITAVVSILSSLTVSLLIYYKYLKRIPENTETKIQDLLDKRLGYETTNHNAIISKLDHELRPNNAEQAKTSSKEHQLIFDDVKYLRDMALQEKQRKKDSAAFMSTNTGEINQMLGKLANLSEVIEHLSIQNHELSEKVQFMQQKNQILENENIKLRSIQYPEKQRVKEKEYELEF